MNALKDKLITALLTAKIKNENLENFKRVLNTSYKDFSDEKATLDKKTEAFLLLKDIEKDLEILSSYPDIFTKKIIAVGGGFSTGKSCFISSFFDDEQTKLPADIEPTTAIPTYVVNSSVSQLLACSIKGASIDLDSIQPEFHRYLTHEFLTLFKFNPKELMPYIVYLTQMSSKKDICFIDTPGYNPPNNAGGYTHQDLQIAREYISKANDVIWLVTGAFLSQSDIDFIKKLRLKNKNLYIVLNKADQIPPSELEKGLKYIDDTCYDNDIHIKGVSAYSSFKKQELAFLHLSLNDFLDQTCEQTSIYELTKQKLSKVYDMHKNSLEQTIASHQTNKKTLGDTMLNIIKLSSQNPEQTQSILNSLQNIQNQFDTLKLERNLVELDEIFTQLYDLIDKIFSKDEQ